MKKLFCLSFVFLFCFYGNSQNTLLSQESLISIGNATTALIKQSGDTTNERLRGLQDEQLLSLNNGNEFIALLNRNTTATPEQVCLFKNGATKKARIRLMISFLNTATFGTFEVYKNPTITANGAAITINNLNTSSTTTSTALFFDAPTISANGTLIYVWAMGTDQRNFVNELNFLIKTSDNLLFRRTGGGGAGNELRFNIIWSEE